MFVPFWRAPRSWLLLHTSGKPQDSLTQQTRCQLHPKQVLWTPWSPHFPDSNININQNINMNINIKMWFYDLLVRTDKIDKRTSKNPTTVMLWESMNWAAESAESSTAAPGPERRFIHWIIPSTDLLPGKHKQIQSCWSRFRCFNTPRCEIKRKHSVAQTNQVIKTYVDSDK